METGDYASRSDKMLEQVIKFRQNNANHLFPPFSDFPSTQVAFNREALNQKTVRFSRRQQIKPESWAEIIKRDPILYREGGRIPDYWTTKPVDEKAVK